MRENRQTLIKKVVKIVVENKKPKKLIKKRKNEVQGGVERVECAWSVRGGCLRGAWSVLEVCLGRIDTTAPGPL